MKPIIDERVLRHVSVISDPTQIKATYTKSITPMEYVKNDRGYCFKAMRRHDGVLMVNPDGRAGLVCFCKEEIPTNHTHFIIQRMHPDGKWVIVTPVVGNVVDLLENVRTPLEMQDEIDERLRGYVKGMTDAEFFDLVCDRVPKNDVYGPFVGELLDLVEEINTCLDEKASKLKGLIMNHENPKGRELFSKIVQKMFDTRGDIINAVAKL